MPASPPPLPHFFLIGAPRTGVRWLRFNLDQHPEICAPPLDLHFYAQPHLVVAKTTRWYRDHFATWNGEALLGETSPRYLSWKAQPPLVALRLHNAQPDARLVAIVRNPLERSRSASAQGILRGEIPRPELAQTMDPEVFVNLTLALTRDSVYAPNLGRFRELFGDQLKIMVYDDLVADPRGFYAEVLTHVGADPTFVPDQLERRRFVGRDMGLAPVEGQDSADLYSLLFKEQVDVLGSWLGRDLSGWAPPVGPRSG